MQTLLKEQLRLLGSWGEGDTWPRLASPSPEPKATQEGTAGLDFRRTVPCSTNLESLALP